MTWFRILGLTEWKFAARKAIFFGCFSVDLHVARLELMMYMSVFGDLLCMCASAV